MEFSLVLQGWRQREVEHATVPHATGNESPAVTDVRALQESTRLGQPSSRGPTDLSRGIKQAHNFQQALAQFQTWGGWSTSHLCIMEVVKQLRISGPCRYLEIGVNEGLSVYALVTSLRLQRILHQSHRLTEPLFDELVLADSWSALCGGTGRGSNQHISGLLQCLHVTSNHTAFLDGDSKETVPDYLHGRREPMPFDIVYVDGDHSYAGTLCDLENVLPHVGSVLFFDDMYHPSHCVADRLLEVHIAMVERLRHDFYTFLNRQWFGFAAFVRKAVFDAAP